MESSTLTLPANFNPAQLEFDYQLEENQRLRTDYRVWSFAWALALVLSALLWQQIRLPPSSIVESVTALQVRITSKSVANGSKKQETNPSETKPVTTKNPSATPEQAAPEVPRPITKRPSLLQMSRESAHHYTELNAPSYDSDGVSLPQPNRVFSNSLRRTLESAEVASINTRRLSHRSEEFESVYGDQIFRQGDTCYVIIDDPAIENFGVFQKCLRPPPEIRRFGQRQVQ